MNTIEFTKMTFEVFLGKLFWQVYIITLFYIIKEKIKDVFNTRRRIVDWIEPVVLNLFDLKMDRIWSLLRAAV